MGNCLGLKSESDENERTQHLPRRNQYETPISSPPSVAQTNINSNFPSHPIYTIPKPEVPQQQPSRQVQVETIDSDGFTILSQNPQLRYKANLVIQNDSFFGKIYFAYLCDKKVALKEFKSKQSLRREAEILSSLDHKNIVNFLMKFEALNNRFFLVIDFGDKLSRGLHLKNDSFKKDAMMQLTNAVEYLQSMRIVHCQIMPENIFVRNYGTSCIFKLGNFSKAVKIQAISPYNEEYVEEYSAPEVRRISHVCLASDIWSLACVFFFFTTAQKMLPIVYENQMGAINARIKVITGETTNFVLLRDMISKMLKYQTSKRLSAKDVKSHPFFWTAKEMIDLIIDVSRLMEKDDREFLKVLSKGSHKVYGESWVERIDEDVITELKAIKKAFQKGNFNRGKNKEDFNEKSIKSLITTIRNIGVHARSQVITVYMGENDEQLMEYWNDKFPSLISHIYNAKLQFDNKENIY